MSAKIWCHSQTLWNAEGCCIREREMTQAWIPNLKEETNEEYQKWLKIKEIKRFHFISLTDNWFVLTEASHVLCCI